MNTVEHMECCAYVQFPTKISIASILDYKPYRYRIIFCLAPFDCAIQKRIYIENILQMKVIGWILGSEP